MKLMVLAGSIVYGTGSKANMKEMVRLERVNLDWRNKGTFTANYNCTGLKTFENMPKVWPSVYFCGR